MQTAHQHTSGLQQSLELKAANLQTEIDDFSADAEQISKIKMAERRDAWLAEVQASKDERLKALESVQEEIEGLRGRVQGLQTAVECAGKGVGEKEEVLEQGKAEARAFMNEFGVFAKETGRIGVEVKRSAIELGAVLNAQSSEK
jgi:chromosome segregation ATPase